MCEDKIPIVTKYLVSAFGHGSRTMAVPQRPMGLDIKLSQPKFRLNYQLIARKL